MQRFNRQFNLSFRLDCQSKFEGTDRKFQYILSMVEMIENLN